MDEKPAMAANERTPLIQVIQVRPVVRRYPHTTQRRLCTLVLALVLLFAVIASFTSLIISGQSDFWGEHGSSPWQSWFPGTASLPHRGWPQSYGITYEELQEILLTTPSGESAKEWSKYYTAGPHLAGTNISQAIQTQQWWQSFGVKQSSIVAYDTYLNYPLGHRLAMYNKTDLVYEASLEEDVLDEDPTTGLENRIPTFHGYSVNGNVTAPFVFVNYGTYADFEDLQKKGVDLKGKIALAKYGAIFRGLKVKRAAEVGMVGVIMYSDPGDDANVTEENGFDAYPAGPARNPSSVQRGSVQFISVSPGDPTTPGYPSKPGVPRQPVDRAIPSIPSIPISYKDALPLLKTLNGKGPKAKGLGKRWEGGGLGYKGVDYYVGPSPKGVVVNLVNEQEYVTTPEWDVIGVINGTIQDEVVVVGNHRDAWLAGGAGDPNSGSATLNEMVRAFGKAIEKGWKPLRTIVFASWDGEEYGLIGSTEWVEEYLPWLSKASVAYLNVDVSTSGPSFSASASPLLNKALLEITGMVKSPNQTIPGQSVADTWSKRISTLGSGSDYTAFQDHAGIPSIDMGFGPSANSPVYHYHSNYDSFHWMEKYGDPTFEYHATASKIWGLLTAKIAEEPVIQFNATDYAVGLDSYLKKVIALAEEKELDAGSEERDEFEEGRKRSSPSLSQLKKTLTKLYDASSSLDAKAEALASQASAKIPWWKWYTRAKLYYQVRKVNTKYKYLEREFLYEGGLDSRPWFKHIVFAPGLWTGYAGATFPGLVEAIDDRDKGRVDKWMGIAESCLKNATKLLEG